MAFEEQHDDTVYLVLVNEEDQYSLWPKSNSIPSGWRVVKEGTRAEYGVYVSEVWTEAGRSGRLRNSIAQSVHRSGHGAVW